MSFFIGYGLSFSISLKGTFILLGGVPLIMLAGFLGAKSGMSGVKDEMIAY